MGGIGWGVCIFLLGSLLTAAGTPKVDRRFTTGYKHNEVPNQTLVGLGSSLAGIGILTVLVAWNFCSATPSAAPDVIVQHDMAIAVDAGERTDMAKRHRRAHAKAALGASTAPEQVAPASGDQPLDPYQ